MIFPMLLETCPDAFSNEAFIFEPKIDGHRLLLDRSANKTSLYTRHKNMCTLQYPELGSIGLDDVLLDGEVAATKFGKVNFEAIMERFSLKKEVKIKKAAERQPVNYVVFDILRYQGKDLRAYPLIQRKELLASLNFNNPHIGLIPSIEGQGELLFEQMVSLQMEGMVAKRLQSTYIHSRSKDWLKVINWTYVDIYLTGYRKSEFGWLASVQEGNGQFRPVGIIELGVAPRHKMMFYKIKDQLAIGEDKNYVYLDPRIKAKVKIRNWTNAGLLRSPAFVDFVV